MASIVIRNGKFLCQVKRKGQGKSKHFTDRAAAERWGAMMEEMIDNGHITPESLIKFPTLIKALERYKDEITPKKRSAPKENYRIDNLMKESFAKKQMHRVTAQDIADFRDRRLETVGDQTIIHDLNLLGHVYKIARQEWGYRKLENPLEFVSKPKQPEPRRRRLNSKTEMLRFMESLNNYTAGGREFPLFVKFQIATAMRKSEALNLTWKDINWEKKLAFLPITKNGKARYVPLSPDAIAILQQLKINSFKPFANLGLGKIRDHFAAVCRKALIANYRIHDLRRECISRLDEAGATPKEIMMVSGHTSEAMVRRYTVREELKVVDALAQIFARQQAMQQQAATQ